MANDATQTQNKPQQADENGEGITNEEVKELIKLDRRYQKSLKWAILAGKSQEIPSMSYMLINFIQ